MKNLIRISSLFLLLLSVFLMAMKVEKKEMLKIGENMPNADLKLLNVDTKRYSLNDIAEKNGVLVIFSCNTCPFVIGNGTKSEGWENRYPGLGDLCKKSEIGMVLVNSNEGKREAGDSFLDMQARYKEKNYNAYYLYDEHSVLADDFGALTTPHVYLFDASHKLVYRGAIDDNVDQKEAVKENYLIDAINHMLSGEKISPETTRQLGCSIKRV